MRLEPQQWSARRRPQVERTAAALCQGADEPIITAMRASKRVKTAGMRLALAGILSAVSSSAPTAGQKPEYALKEKVRLVTVPVTVKDKRGDLVEDLRQEDFLILEDGQQRPIQLFSNESALLSAVILLDAGLSESSAAAVRSSLGSLSNSFAAMDEEALYIFDNSVRLVQDFTSQTDLWSGLGKKVLPPGKGPSLMGGPLAAPPNVNGVPANGPGTGPPAAPPPRKRIDDALYTAAQRLKSRPLDRRRVIVIVSDGINGSDNDFSYSEALKALTASGVTVYAVSFGSGWALKRADLLARVARDTGGDIAYVRRRAGLARAFFDLANEARNSYVVGFAPASADGRFHEIRVRVRRSGVRWMARNRFFSPPEP